MAATQKQIEAPRQVSDPKYGTLGTIQKTSLGWESVSKGGWVLGVHPNKRFAVIALYRDHSAAALVEYLAMIEKSA